MAKGDNNYIKRLQDEKKDLLQTLNDIQWKLIDLEVYLTSSKFHGSDNDYVHVSTDMLPKLREVRSMAIITHHLGD